MSLSIYITTEIKGNKGKQRTLQDYARNFILFHLLDTIQRDNNNILS